MDTGIALAWIWPPYIWDLYKDVSILMKLFLITKIESQTMSSFISYQSNNIHIISIIDFLSNKYFDIV